MAPKVLIIFGTTYGRTEQYANWLADALRQLDTAPEVEVVSAQEVTEDQALAADSIIVGGSDYGGFLNGAPKLRKKIIPIMLEKKDKTAFYTVSFTGPYSKAFLDKQVAKSYTPALTEGRPVYHLRGGIDFSILSTAHKVALRGPVHAWLIGKNATDPNPAVTEMLECYKTGKSEHASPDQLEPLIEDIKAFL